MKVSELMKALHEIAGDEPITHGNDLEVVLYETVDNMGSGTGLQLQQFEQPIGEVVLFFTSNGECKVGITS